MNFKRGDKVVIMRENSPIDKERATFVNIIEYGPAAHYAEVKLPEPLGHFVIDPKYLILEEIYNSPLFQALQEQ